MITLALGQGDSLVVSPERAANIRDQITRALNGYATDRSAPPSTISPLVLDDGHPFWDQHTGLDGHSEPEWNPKTDLPRAQAFYERVGGKAKVFLDLLIDHPGRLLNVDELCELSGGAFSGSRSIAGTINGLYRPQQSSDRRYPFYWWAGNPARYAMKPSVTALFRKARGR